MIIEPQSVFDFAQSVWTTVLGVPLYPCGGRVDLGTPTMRGSVNISGMWKGTVTIECSERFARWAAARMFDERAEDASLAEVGDALGELTNMVGGNLKGLLPGPNQLSTPTFAQGPEPKVMGESIDHVLHLEAWGEPVVVKVHGHFVDEDRNVGKEV